MTAQSFPHLVLNAAFSFGAHDDFAEADVHILSLASALWAAIVRSTSFFSRIWPNLIAFAAPAHAPTLHIFTISCSKFDNKVGGDALDFAMKLCARVQTFADIAGPNHNTY